MKMSMKLRHTAEQGVSFVQAMLGKVCVAINFQMTEQRSVGTERKRNLAKYHGRGFLE